MTTDELRAAIADVRSDLAQYEGLGHETDRQLIQGVTTKLTLLNLRLAVPPVAAPVVAAAGASSESERGFTSHPAAE